MKDDSAPPSGGVGSSRWKELIEVASPIYGSWIPHFRHWCPALPFPRVTHSPLVGGRAGPRRPPPADVSAYSRPGGWSTCGRVR